MVDQTTASKPLYVLLAGCPGFAFPGWDVVFTLDVDAFVPQQFVARVFEFVKSGLNDSSIGAPNQNHASDQKTTKARRSWKPAEMLIHSHWCTALQAAVGNTSQSVLHLCPTIQIN